MPRYYFDVNDGSHTVINEEGDDLKSEQEARTHVRKILLEQAPKLLRGGDAAEITIKVRDITGPLFRAKLSAAVG